MADTEALWAAYLQAKETAITAESGFRMTVNGCGIGFSGPSYLAYYQAQMAADQAYTAYLHAMNPRRPLQ
jgi:hypothetical protein